MKEDWPILLSFFPDNWAEMASATDALKGLRKSKDAENYIRTLLLHLACGYSMRETAARAKLADIANISDVALIGRLRKAKDWLHKLCMALFEEQIDGFCNNDSLKFRLFDATNVKEPGRTGSLWRIHYSLQIPSLSCDFFKLTPTKGKGTGESFFQYSIKKNDYIIADRGYSTAAGIHHVASKKAKVLVRVNTQTLLMKTLDNKPFPLLSFLEKIKVPGSISSIPISIPGKNKKSVLGRLCIIRKSNEAIKIAHKKIIRRGQKKGHKIKPGTFEYAKFVIVFTNYPEKDFSEKQVLNLYRSRWQVELVFKRFKSIAQLGHLPKYNEDSSKAWLYGKMFVALLTEKIIRHATAISPWGYIVEDIPAAKHLA